jgi:hypothetical protein
MSSNNLNELNDLNKIKNIIENNIDFITSFVNLKLDDMCFHLSLFFYYLIKERDNFNSNDLKLKITNQMLLYIINELYNCPNFTINTNTYLDSKLKNEVKLKDEKQLINKYIYNKIVEVKEKDVYNIINEYIEKLMIKTNIGEESRVVVNIKNIIIDKTIDTVIYDYIKTCIKNIIYLEDRDNSGDLNKKYEKLQYYVITNKREYNMSDSIMNITNLNQKNSLEMSKQDKSPLNEEIINITFNSFLNIIIWLTDWLEIDKITNFEIEIALYFILTKEMREDVNKWVKEYDLTIENIKQDKIKLEQVNTKFKMLLSKIIYVFKKYNLEINIETSQLLLKYIYILYNNIESETKNKDLLDILNDVFKDIIIN